MPGSSDVLTETAKVLKQAVPPPPPVFTNIKEAAAKRAGGAPIGHWHKLYEDFQTSPLNFYTAVEAAIARREIPFVALSRVEWKEGGATSASREYLRVSRGNLNFDICAAPCGKGFFFSWWLAEGYPSRIKALLAVLGVTVLILLASFWMFGFGGGLVVSVLGLIGAFISAGTLIAQGESSIASSLLAVPLLGVLWEALFLPATYYRLDTRSMFMDAVKAAVFEVVDQVTKAEGRKPLSDEERKPILKEFFSKK